ncbi:MAG: DnaJ-class molecular chaperone [Candidatus Methanohalarchaeum thermophilum]|uniref:DnaJ-class molecular chaperone n=1 Tax=Methanohalarchaeum thermophilum TaxID=1903181 RepID=A0A1Q6DVV5_METT1|nr:MAG: DnaJ-class molecular chaperone [Candidatus Methanohalarchaeum thermophilum]
MGLPSVSSNDENAMTLEDRAKKILGIARDVEINEKKLKKIFRQKAKENHPDMNPENEKATEYFKLVLQAKNYLEGEKENKKLLKNDKLVEEYLNEPIPKLIKSYDELIEAYENWRKNQFYDVENKSIWPK